MFSVTQEKNGNSPNSPLKSPSKIPSYQPRPASITPKTRSRSTSKQRLSLKVSPENDQPEPLIKSERKIFLKYICKLTQISLTKIVFISC